MIKNRLRPFSFLASYISPSDLGSPSRVEDIADILEVVPVVHHLSKNILFLECVFGHHHYVLGKCCYRYDFSHQITVVEFATANMRGERYVSESNYSTGIHLLRKHVPGMWMYFFSKLIAFCKESGIKTIRLVADETTGSELFYKKVAQRFSDSFEKVTEPDYYGAIFFYLK